MEASQARRAIEAAKSIVRELGLAADDAAIIHNSDRIVVRLVPCDVLVRIGPDVWQDSFQFEAEVARRLAETGSPVGELEPHTEPRAYRHDGFVLTFWRYYEPRGDIAPADYADALLRIHAGLRQIDLAVPPITERIAGWLAELNDPAQNPQLPDTDRELLSSTISRVQTVMDQQPANDQVLHGEPHPGNLLSTRNGPLFIDFHTCQRGPVEYDIAFIPEEAAAYYPRVNQHLVQEFRILNWAGFTTMRWRATDQFPNRDHWRVEGFGLLRAALERA